MVAEQGSLKPLYIWSSLEIVIFTQRTFSKFDLHDPKENDIFDLLSLAYLSGHSLLPCPMWNLPGRRPSPGRSPTDNHPLGFGLVGRGHFVVLSANTATDWIE